jgi:hypothetical protein
VTEKLHFFVAEYEPDMRIGSGCGNPDEGVDIEVLELPIDEALAMIGDGRIEMPRPSCSCNAALNVFR